MSRMLKETRPRRRRPRPLLLEAMEVRRLLATFTVNSTVDDVDANPGDGVAATSSGLTTLRAAIQEANALAGPDTINLPAGTYTLTRPGAGEDGAATGDLDISGDLTIVGAGAGTTIIDGNQLDRVFQVFGAKVSISGVTVQNGLSNAGMGIPFVSAAGGGMANNGGNLTLTDCVVRNNNAGGSAGVSTKDGGGITNGDEFNQGGGTVTLIRTTVGGNIADLGGGIFNNDQGTLVVRDSTIDGNTANQSGGGVSFGAFGNNLTSNVTITGSTISHNTAGSGGGIFRGRGTLFVTDSTISDNQANTNGSGGGAFLNNNFNDGPVSFAYTTITGNTTGGNGGGISNLGGPLTLTGTIVAGNTAPGAGPDIDGSVTSGGYNLIQDPSGTSITGNTTGNILNQSANLGPLLDNGGPTFTRAPLVGSPAIDAGNPAGAVDAQVNPLAVDQRGVVRPQGPRVDIGAVERTAPPPSADLSVTVSAPATAFVGQDLTYALSVHNGGPDGATGVTVSDTLPAGVTFVSATGGVTPSNGVIVFPVGALASGAGATLTIVVTPTAAGTLTDQAIVSADQADPDTSNNTSKASTTVSAASMTTTTLASSQNPSVVGQPVTFTATVKATTSGGGAPGGSISFSDGSALLGKMDLDPATGQATITVSGLVLGSHRITASYSGDPGHVAGAPGALVQVVRAAAPFTWTGRGPDDHWTDGANWLGGSAPAPGDRLIFPAGAARLTNVDNFPEGSAFGSITFTGALTKAGYILTGNRIAVGAGGITDMSSGAVNAVRDDLTFPGVTAHVTVPGAGQALILADHRSGTAKLVKQGAGTLMLMGPETGPGVTQVAAGTLVGQSAGALGSDAASLIVASGAEVVLSDTGAVGKPLTLNGALLSQSGRNSWTGPIVTPTAQPAVGVFSVAAGSTLTVSGPISGFEVQKRGPGVLVLTAQNSFRSLLVMQGIVVVTKNAALGQPGSPTQVFEAATLQIFGDRIGVLHPISLNPGGILQSVGGSNTIGALGVTLTLLQSRVPGPPAVIDVAAGRLDERGSIVDAFRQGFVKTGAGLLTLRDDGTQDKGPIEVRAGTLAAFSATALGPAGSDATQVDAGATLDVPTNNSGNDALNDELFLAGTGVEHGGALHFLAPPPTEEGFIELKRPVHLIGTATINLDANSAALVEAPIDIPILDIHGRAVDRKSVTGLVKGGPGALQFFGSNSFGPVTVLAGELEAFNEGAISAAVVQGGATLFLQAIRPFERLNLVLSNGARFVCANVVSTVEPGSVTIGGRVTVDVDSVRPPAELDLNETPLKSSSGATLVKTGFGLLALQAFAFPPNHTIQADFHGTIDIQTGAVGLSRYSVDGGEFVVERRGTLRAISGQDGVGGIEAQTGSTVEAGASGQFVSHGAVTLGAGSMLKLTLSNFSGVPLLDAQSGVTLGGALRLVAVAPPGLPPVFTLIRKDSPGPVVGTFQDLPEGKTVTVGGVTYGITYKGGDGNDVLLIPTAGSKVQAASLATPAVTVGVAPAPNPGFGDVAVRLGGAVSVARTSRISAGAAIYPRGPVKVSTPAPRFMRASVDQAVP